MYSGWKSVRFIASVTAMILCGQAWGQTTHTVELTGLAFVPDDLTISVGDTVHWVWLNGTHNVESGVDGVHDGNFRSGNPVSGAVYDVTFDQAFLTGNPMPNNEYPYYCLPHWPAGMSGIIRVQVPAAPAVGPSAFAAMAALLIGAAWFVFRFRGQTVSA